MKYLYPKRYEKEKENADSVNYKGLTKMNLFPSQELLSCEVMKCLKGKQSASITQSSLIKHEIEEHLRTKMVDWMMEVISKFELNIKTFFLSVKLLDKFLQNSQREFSSSYLLLIGVTCMFIASKLEDVGNYKIYVFVKQIAHNRITPDDIKRLEKEILITLDFDVNFVVCSDFLALMCDVYRIPDIVKNTTENILILLQLYYNTQLLPSFETACALLIASKSLNFNLSSEIILNLYSDADFLNKATAINQLLLSYNDSLKKYRSAMIFRKFEIITTNSVFSIQNYNENSLNEQ